MPDRLPPPGMAAPAAVADKPSRMPPPGGLVNSSKGKATPEDSQVIRANEHCIDCSNYDPTSGECEKVQGSFDPQDACSEYFSAIGSDEPDADDEGGASDADADDEGTMQ